MANWIPPSVLFLKPENLSHENRAGLNGNVLLTAISVVRKVIYEFFYLI